MDTIGGRIRAELVRLNLTMRDAAGPLAISKSQVSKLCRGTADLDVPTLVALVKLTGRTADYFLSGRETIPALPDDERRVVDLYRYLRDATGLGVNEALHRLSLPVAPADVAGASRSPEIGPSAPAGEHRIIRRRDRTDELHRRLANYAAETDEP